MTFSDCWGDEPTARIPCDPVRPAAAAVPPTHPGQWAGMTDLAIVHAARADLNTTQELPAVRF